MTAGAKLCAKVKSQVPMDQMLDLVTVLKHLDAESGQCRRKVEMSLSLQSRDGTASDAIA